MCLTLSASHSLPVRFFLIHPLFVPQAIVDVALQIAGARHPITFAGWERGDPRINAGHRPGAGPPGDGDPRALPGFLGAA